MLLDTSSIVSFLKALSRAHVVCVGDVILDFFVHGTVSRISPEAPIPVLLETRQTCSIGGAGNVVRNLSSLGVQTHFISVVGTDQEGDLVHTMATQLDNVQADLLRDPLRPTSVKTRYLSQGGAQILRVDREIALDFPPSLLGEIEGKLKAILTPSSALILSDYGKGMLPKNFLQKIISFARSLGVFVAIDPKGDEYEKYRGASLMTPNLKELTEGVNRKINTSDEIVSAARDLMHRNEIDSVLVTRGQHGMSLVVSGKDPLHIPAKALDVYDVSGAGDTVIATLTAAYNAGFSLEESAHFSNLAAGIVVGKVGTAAVTPEDLERAVLGRYTHCAQVVTHQEALEQVLIWHRLGKKVGFTNGCFDLLHPGHLKSLREAKSLCDYLIVALNSDASVRNLKGQERPIQTQEARAELLCALEYVDIVIVFDEPSPERLIRTLKPDVLVKGADYTIDQLAGADFVQSYGGVVHLVELAPGRSTTSLVNKMKEAVA